MNAKLFAASFCIFMPNFGWALTYDQALNHAIIFDKKYASAIYEAQAAEYIPTIGRAGLLPKLSITGFAANNNLTTQNQSGFFGNPTTVEQNYTSQSYAGQLTQPVINLAAVANYLQSKKQEKASQYKLSVELNDLKTKVIESYCAFAYAQTLLAESTKELSTLTEQEAILKARQLAGASSKTDIDEVVYAKLQVQANLDDAQNLFTQSKLSLEKLIGIKLSQNEFMTTPPTAPLINSSLHELIDHAKNINPKILYQQENYASAILENKKNKAAHIPTVDVVGYQGYQNSNTISTVGQKSMQGYLGFQLNVPLITGGETFGKERQSAFNAESQRMLLESEINDVVESVQKLYSQAKISSEKTLTIEHQVQVANALYKSFKRQQELGLKSTYDLLIATRKKFQSEKDLLKTKYEYIQAIKKLEILVSEH